MPETFIDQFDSFQAGENRSSRIGERALLLSSEPTNSPSVLPPHFPELIAASEKKLRSNETNPNQSYLSSLRVVGMSDWMADLHDSYVALPILPEGWQEPSNKPIRLKLPHSISDIDPVRLYLTEIGRYPLLTKEGERGLGKIMHAGDIAASRLIQSPDTVSPEEHQEARQLIVNGMQARQTLYERNLRLVVSIAKRYHYINVPLLDLTQEGNLGLDHAVEKFDYKKGYKLSTYATPWIRQAIQRGIPNLRRTIRVPMHADQLYSDINKAKLALEQQGVSDPSYEQIAAETHQPVEKIIEYTAYQHKDVFSLDEPSKDGKHTFGDYVARTEDTHELFQVDVSEETQRYLNCLDEVEREIIALRFGIGVPSLSFKEIALHVSRSERDVKSIHSRALSKMKKSANEEEAVA